MRDRILSDFFHPEKYLRQREQKSIFSHFNRNAEWKVRVITFNYTRTLENLLGNSELPIEIEFQNEGKRFLTQLVHIHGYIGERMILGVNDISQLNNQQWHSNQKILRRYIKPIHNDTYKLDHEGLTKDLISNSSVICLFGVSIGETDKLWWSAIADRLDKFPACRLIIFYYLPDFEPVGNYGPEYEDNVDMVKNLFLKAAGYRLNCGLRSQIYVTFQRTIFNIKLRTNNQ